MPGTITVDVRATFSAMLLMGVSQRLKFGTDEPDITKAGERKYECQVAVTYHAEPGMRPVSEVLTIVVTGGDHAAILGMTPGSAVEVDRLRQGVSAVERKEGGRVSGGRPYWMASSIRLAGAGGLRPVKNEQAS
jgi:hypothetical protein